ncbi:MAG: dihydroorotate dehydrogenase [Candidatus Micrarchaeia archaeon]
MKPDLNVNLCGVKLSNPTILASGILGLDAETLFRVAQNGAGAVTFKSVGTKERKGHDNPTLIANKHYLLNAMGFPNPGAEYQAIEIEKYKKKTRTPAIASVMGSNLKDFKKIITTLCNANPDLIEIDISCPNVDAEYGAPFACNAKAAEKATKEAVKHSTKPVFIKLSPNIHPQGFRQVAKAVEKAGANGITATNTLSGIAINAEAGKPILTNVFGGVSGPALKPVALRCVFDAFNATKIPLIGTGGVTDGSDAAEMILAGASAVGIGSATHYRGIDAFKKTSNELSEFMKKQGYKKISDFQGKAHK